MKELIKSNKWGVRIFFFLIGIIATFAYRVIIVLNIYSPRWVNFAWYVGTIGFILYFWHRYRIQNRREKLVEEYNLVDVIRNCQNPENATDEDRRATQILHVVRVAVPINGVITDESKADARELIAKYDLNLEAFDKAIDNA